MTDQLAIRALRETEMGLPLAWAEREGWNPGLDDGPAFHVEDPGGFLVGEIDGDPACVISAVRYGTVFGFIGFYICRPDLRGRGLGHQIWARAMELLGSRVVGLDAVKEQQPTYAGLGFVPTYRNLRFAGVSTANTPMDMRLAPLGKGLFPSILDYDAPFFPGPRAEFLRLWTAPTVKTRRGFALIEDGSPCGYGVIRKCINGYKIGPLFADNADHADLLFRALAGQAKGDMVVLDVPEPNKAALALAERYQLSPEFETARMYRGPAPDLPLERTFGITTFELG